MEPNASDRVATSPGGAARAIPVCPHCGAQLAAPADRCPACAGDLRPLLRTAELADRYFNDAVAAARARDWLRASECLAVTLALRPDDVGGLVLLGKVRRRQRQPAAALAAWREALQLAPDHEEARLAIAEVEAAQQRRAPAGRRRRRGSGRRAGKG